jgi:hypothetical protein
MKSSLKALTTLIALFAVIDLIMLNLYAIYWMYDIVAIFFLLLGYLPFQIKSLRLEKNQQEPTAIFAGILLLIMNIVGIILSVGDFWWEPWIGPSLWMNSGLLGWILGLYRQDRENEFLNPNLELDAA